MLTLNGIESKKGLKLEQNDDNLLGDINEDDFFDLTSSPKKSHIVTETESIEIQEFSREQALKMSEEFEELEYGLLDKVKQDLASEEAALRLLEKEEILLYK